MNLYIPRVHLCVPNIPYAYIYVYMCVQAIANAGYTGKIKIGMDVAASEFYQDGKYNLDFKNPNADPSMIISGEELMEVGLTYTWTHILMCTQ